ncbi:MAG: APC family permease [Promethearchaeota archaeon]
MEKLTNIEQLPKKKDIKLRSLIYSGLGGTIGGPIYVIIGNVISEAGAGVIISLIFLSFLLILIVMNYSELSLALPKLGGGYSFSKETVGGIWGFLIGWVMWLGNVTFGAVSGLSFVYSLAVFFPNRAGIEANYVPLIGFIVVLIYTFLNLWAYKFLKKMMKVFTFILIFGFVIYIIVGLGLGWILNPDNFTPKNLTYNINIKSIIQVSPIIIGIFCIYEWNSSFESITAMVEEIKQPRKKVPKGFMYAILTACIIYISVAITTIINIGIPNGNLWIFITNSTNPLADSFYNLIGVPGLLIIGTAGMLCTMTSLNSAMQLSYRILFAMARDGLFPKILTKKYEKTMRANVSGPSIVTSCIVIMFFTITFNVQDLVNISNFIMLIMLGLICLMVILLRKQRPNLVRPYKAPLYPYTSVIALIAIIALIVPIAPPALIFGTIMILGGITIYSIEIARRDRLLLLLIGAKIGGILICSFYLISTQFKMQLVFTLTIVIIIISIISIIFDFLPMILILKEITLFKDKNAQIVSDIVEIGENEQKFALIFSILKGIIQIIVGIILSIIASLIYSGSFPVNAKLFDIGSNSIALIGTSIYAIFAVTLIIAGMIDIYLQIEIKRI